MITPERIDNTTLHHPGATNSICTSLLFARMQAVSDLTVNKEHKGNTDRIEHGLKRCHVPMPPVHKPLALYVPRAHYAGFLAEHCD
jgi:hypothetical protein